MLPVVNADERGKYFGSSQAEYNFGIYQVVWSDDNAQFETPVPVAELNGPSGELPDWLSPDGCRLYLHGSDQGYDQGWSNPQLVASKPPLAH